MAKTDWKYNDLVTEQDMNELGEEINGLAADGAAVKESVDAATNAAAAETLVKRDANGRAQVSGPLAAGDIANKGYVDAAISSAAVPDASLTAKGKVQLSSATDSTSEVLAATPAAVKAAYDRGSDGVVAAAGAQSTANAAQTTANGAVQKENGYWPGGDANTCKIAGTYYFTADSLNTPTGDWCTILVISGWLASDRLIQIANVWNLSDDIFCRRLNASSWSPWVKMWTSGNDGAGSGLDADTARGQLAMPVCAWHTDPRFSYDGTTLSWSAGYLINNGYTYNLTAGTATTTGDRWIIGTINGPTISISTAYGWGQNLAELATNQIALGYIGQYNILSLLYGAGTGLFRNNGGTAEFFDHASGGWKPVGGIKSVQRGQTRVVGGQLDVTISAVNPNKSFITTNFIATGGYQKRVWLSNSTTLSFESTGSESQSAAYNVAWEVVESY